MITDFSVFYGQTVPKSYNWDLGAPFESPNTTVNADTYLCNNTLCISGYAPGLKVVFGNQSFSDAGFELADFLWDFGDYYHDSNNFVALSCSTGIIEHTYIMPGTYTVSLRHTQSQTTTELDQTGNDLLCRGKYDYKWFWDETKCTITINGTPVDNLKRVTWDETKCNPPLTAENPRPKQWDSETKCFGKYCKFWNWAELDVGGTNPVTWAETDFDEVFEKKWMDEANDTICTVSAAEFLNTLQTQQQSVFKTVVTVKEIMPVANMYPVSAVVGSSPLTVQLSPRNCKQGSFPIDRIDWNFGDGSPIKTITRYVTNLEDPEILDTKYFPADSNDVRNYDVIHTYNRVAGVYPVFYPSLTCYSANTHSSDSCSITIGPIDFTEITSDLHLLKARNTLKGNIYAFDIDENIALMTSNNFNKPLTPVPNIPVNPIRNSKGIFQNDRGYNGDGYPALYIPSCEITESVGIPIRLLTTEDPTPFNTTDNLSAVSGVPIITEGSSFIYV